MAKSIEKSKKTAISRKKTIKIRPRVCENVDSLLELHKLQGVLLKQLRNDQRQLFLPSH